MTRWPEYISSTCPFMSPRSSCWRSKYFWERPITTAMNTNPTSEDSMAVTAMVTLVYSIMITDPPRRVMAVAMVLMLWFIDWPRVSTSLVTRLITSPVVLVSK